MDGRMDVKAILRIASRNTKFSGVVILNVLVHKYNNVKIPAALCNNS
jgi:hypothetical protein